MTLNDICHLIVDCPHTTAPDEGIGIPLIRTPNIGKGRFIFDDVHRVSQEVYQQRIERAIPQDNDIIFAREAIPGNAAIIKNGQKMCLGQRTVLIRPNTAKIDPDYLVYYILAPEQQYKLLGTANGATVAHVNLPIIRNMNVDNLPSLKVQQKIGKFLSVYDDLIENNLKQIKLLEEATQRLYKEWFVDFHFPGYETTPIVNGLPQGWKKVSVAECLTMHINGGWGTETEDAKHCFSGRVIRGTDINDIKSGNYSDIPLRYHTKNDIISRSLIENDIVFELSNGNINNIGRTLLIDQYILKQCGKNTICASFCKLFRPTDKLHALILLFEIQEMQLNGKMLVYKKHGSNGINNFAFEDFLKHELLIPDILYISPFELLMQKISICQQQITQLKESRNRLLPILIDEGKEGGF